MSRCSGSPDPPMDDLEPRVRRVEELIGSLEEAVDPAARRRFQEILGLLLDLHQEGLRRLLGLLRSTASPGGDLPGHLAGDPLLSSLLLLHGLHPEDLETRVRGALVRVRPLLASHGGNVELVGLDERGVLRLRLEGSCHGCPSSEATLRSTIQEAVQEAAPEVTDIVLEGLVPQGKELAR